jgi:outer membrane receptor protein involved in Fe transport
VIILFHILRTSIIAQPTAAIKGVAFGSNGIPLPYANIALIGCTDQSVFKGHVSDSAGSFFISELNNGAYKLKVFYLGYNNFETDTFYLTQNDTLEVENLVLTASSQQIEAVEVIAVRKFINHGPGKTTINVADQISAAGENTLELMHHVPSVSTDDENNVLLRGAPATILIDGVESDLGNSLDELPAEVVEKIEIITNPSAKYQAQNGSGIINIILKKEKVRSSNGGAYFSLGFPEKAKTGVNYTLRHKKVSWFNSLNFDYEKDKRISTSERVSVPTADKLKHTYNSGENIVLKNKMGIRQGIKWAIDQKQFINFKGYFQAVDNNNNSDYFADVFGGDTLLINKNNNNSHGKYLKKYANFNSQWNRLLSNDGKLNLQVIYQNRSINTASDRIISHYNVLTDSLNGDYKSIYRNNNELSNRWKVKTDLEFTILSNLKLEFGGVLGLNYLNSVSNQHKISQRNANDSDTPVLVSDTSYKDLFSLDEINTSAYGVVSYQKKNTYISAGGRFEHNRLTLYSFTEYDNINKRYNNFLPTIHFTQKVNKNFQVSLSASKRVKYPRYTHLNPYVIYHGTYSKSGGNPNLLPEYITNIEIATHFQREKLSLTPSLFYKYFENQIGRYQYIVIEDSLDILFTQFSNIGNNQQIGFEINATQKITRSWNLRSNFLILSQRINSRVLEKGITLYNRSFSAKINSDHRLPSKFRLQITAVYESPVNTIYGRISERYYMDLGLKRTISKKLQLYLKLTDIFNTLQIQKTNHISPTLYSYSNIKKYSNRITFTLSYKFNNLK